MSARASIVCFGRGLALSLSKPYLAVSLWLVQLMLASSLILPISNSLHASLDRSSTGSRMVAVPDFGWWETLRREHPDLLGNFPELAENALSPTGVKASEISGLRGIGAAAVALTMLGIVLHAFCLGGVFGTLREPKSSLVTFGREGMRRFPAFLVFTFAAVAASLAAYRWIWIESGVALRNRVQELDTEGKALAVTAVRLLALLAVLAAIKILADSVRAIWVARPDLPPFSRFFMGVGGALSRPMRLLGVLMLYVAVTVLLYGIWLWADPPAGGEARFALVPLILTQQAFVFLRLLVKVGYYAGVSEALSRDRSPEYSYVAAPVVSAETRALDETPLDRAPEGV